MLFRILSDPLAIFLVVLFFGASIFIHELGHFLAARWRGLKIERFSIGFGPRLFGWKDKHGVDWRISLFPLGGYVALPQLADMRGIEGQPSKEADELPPISYADKMIVAGAGAFFNVIFALVLGTVLWVTGIPVNDQLATTRIGYVSEQIIDEDGMERDGPALSAGLKPGDVILSIDGKAVNDWEDIIYGITTGTQRTKYGSPKATLQIKRDSDKQILEVFPILDDEEGIRRLGMAPANSLKVGAVMENSPAQLAGLQAGDRIVAANGESLYHTIRLSEMIRENPDATLNLSIERDDSKLEIPIKAEKVVYNTTGDTTPMIGVQWTMPTTRQHINPIEQITDAFETTIRVLGALINPKSDIGISNLSGPVGISYTLYVISQIGILEVLSIVVLININLAILNLMPIPVLDGGHMAFATFAKLRGRPVPPSVMASAQGIFMLLFLAIFVYVTFFDVGRVKRNENAIMEQEKAAEQRVPIEFKGNAEPETPPPSES